MAAGSAGDHTRCDPQASAIDLVLKLREVLEKSGVGNAIALARRAKDYPQLMLQAGFVPATTYYLSKTDGSLYSELYKALRSKPTELHPKVKENLKKEASEEGKGYTIYLALLAAWLSRYAECNRGVKSLSSCINLGDVTYLAKCLLNLRESGSELRVATVARRFTTEVKKLVEAFYGE